jgi:hypothetical protein
MSNKNKTDEKVSISLRIPASLKQRLERDAEKGFRKLSHQVEMVMMIGLASIDSQQTEEKKAV